MPNKPNDRPDEAGAAAESDRPGETLEPLRHPSAADAGELHRDGHGGAYTHHGVIAGQTEPDAFTEHRERIHDGAYATNEVDITDRNAPKSHGPTTHDSTSTNQTGRR